MRIAWALLAALVFCAAAPSARAQVARPPIVTSDPGAYARAFADQMALSGVAPLREAFSGLLHGAPIPPESEAALHVYESPDMVKPAIVSRVLDDQVVGDGYRVVYLYHYFGGNYWLFTRLEFVRISQSEWALVQFKFASTWTGVVLATTPGFAPPQPARGRR